MRRIVTFFHSSSTATHILKEKQSALQLPEHKLIQDVRTRWNSSFDMMSRYLEQQPAIFATFHHKDVKKNIKDIVTLSETEKSEAEELVNILGPLKKMATILCSEHSPTVSLVHPMSEMLLREMARKSSTSQMVMQASIFCIREKYVLLRIMNANMYAIMYVNMEMSINHLITIFKNMPVNMFKI